MAVMDGVEPTVSFDGWYKERTVNDRTGCIEFRGLSDYCGQVWHRYQRAKREMDLRVANYGVLEKMAGGEVISPKPDLPNISSGETAGLIRRIARNLVQNTPNVEVLSKFDDDSPYGIFARYVLTSKIIGSDLYSNDMQQNLFASTKGALTKGFDCVIPLLQQLPDRSWYIKYDTIHYRDVFPEPGAKDIRQATEVFIRRYLTKGEVKQLIDNNTAGWDHAALRELLKTPEPSREMQSVDYETKKRHQIPTGYEIITLYTNSGDPFLTFSASTKMLLRVEKNKHPLKEHPVHFLVLEKDDQQPLGVSQVELLVGRQDFQDLMLNGAMKLWYRNINPAIIGFGTVNALPNLSPGKYTEIGNPNARIEPFEVNTQTLLQFGTISQQNLGAMVNLVGSPDQQLSQVAGNGMSATPQGVEAQASVVDITSNNYQKAIEAFFSHYCSYALTIYFAELAATKTVTPNAESRKKLLDAGMQPEVFRKDGSLDLDFSQLVTQYWVRCVPGSLTEMEDEKQLRILSQVFVPLSQALPALAATQNTAMIEQAARAMHFIIGKQIELSGAAAAKDIGLIWNEQDGQQQVDAREARIAELEAAIDGVTTESDLQHEVNSQAIAQLQQQVKLLTENNQLLLQKLGVVESPSTPASAEQMPTIATAR